MSRAALIAVKPGQRPRLIYRVHCGRAGGKDRNKGFTEAGYVRLLEAAHQQPGGPLVVVRGNLNTLLDGFLASTRLDLTPFSNPTIKNR